MGKGDTIMKCIISIITLESLAINSNSRNPDVKKIILKPITSLAHLTNLYAK
ncbi:unnamed protein product [marine sediment metagenome]|uniref:Uncharacterized protein n=1 Tax=marine sediment metagenome TaxID=412755 RepID=X1L9E9_9ZZZZ